MTAWIEMLGDDDASPELAHALATVKTPAGTVDNVMRVHSLRPHTMLGHWTLYRSVLHNEGNSLGTDFLEVVASYTSMLNNCAYSLSNHWHNAAALIDDANRADKVHAALSADAPEQAFEGKELELLRYTRELTLNPGDITEALVRAAKDAGATDAEILEVNQCCGYFCYANRTLNGLGVTQAGDMVGFYKPKPAEA
jgi:uncharacterized peroxidase-related enzyme